MERFDDPRIHDALALLDSVARDKKAELQAAIRGQYTHLSGLGASFTDHIREGVPAAFEAGRKKVEDLTEDIDHSVHRYPYAYIGGASLVAVMVGYLMGRAGKDKSA